MKESAVLDAYPLSPLQEGMLFHYLAEGRGDLYVEQSCLQVDGNLDEDLLARAIGQTCARHDCLHAIFPHEGLKRPLQVLVKARPFSFEARRDISRMSQAERGALLAGYLESDRARGFDLASGPLLRVATFREGPGRVTLVWTFHHIIMDGWSLGVFLGDLFSVYGSLASGSPLPRPPAFRYRSYIEWLAARDQAADKEFWAARLGDLPDGSYLKPWGGTPERAGRLGKAEAAVGQADYDALCALAASWNVTPGHLCQAAWALVLGRYSGFQDVCFGVVVAGRPASLPGAETAVGLFINTVARRLAWSDAEGMRHLAERARDSAAEEAAHENSSLSSVQEAAGRSSLFDTLFIYENYPGERRYGDCVVRQLDSYERTNYPAALVLVPGSGLKLILKYDQGFYDQRFSQAVLDAYASFLRRLVAAGDAPADSFRLPVPARPDSAGVGDDEWSATVLDPIQTSVDRVPDAIAASDPSGSLSYRSLWDAAGRAAARLRVAGVGPGNVVGVSLGHGTDALACVLGVLRSGAAYLPLDPGLPSARVGYILRDSGASCLVASGGLAAADWGVSLLSPEVLLAPGAAPEAPETSPGADDPAYVIYTSGSTGEPKGVEISHRNLASYLACAAREYADGSPVSMPFITSISFDLTVTSMFLPLATGGAVISPDGNDVGEKLVRALGNPDINVIKLTPAHLRLLAGMARATPARRRLFIVGGEALSVDACRGLISALGPDTGIVNEYGPTEATVGCIVHRFDPERDKGAWVPIGRPLPNALVRVVDDQGRILPPGAVGELELGGSGLARGYRGKPELSAERFVERDGRRWYRSGDYGRLGPDGLVEYLGRRDGQVKIRGHRVEPAELERALGECPGVAEAAVSVRRDAGGEPYLSAFVSPAGLDAVAVLAWLRGRLPGYLVPARLTVLERLPVNRNGKVDV
ncbi:MAG: amino acid adenylation domain-containing protein, partial [Spirochaetales bacterium]|nr:amino acid adenylation domain-containing protein [Spirochaetales bacterium]